MPRERQSAERAERVQPAAATSRRPPLSTYLSPRWRRVTPAFIQRARWTPAAVILVLAVLMLGAGIVQRSPCLHTTPGWTNGLQFRYACYSDILPLYGDEGFEKPGMFPYQYSWLEGEHTSHVIVRHTEYPVLTGLFMWVNAKFTEAYYDVADNIIYLPKTLTDVTFFEFSAFFLSIFWLISVWCITRMTRRRVWDGVIAALSPIVLVQAFTNFDLLAIGLATTGIYAWSRRRTGLAGALLGLGTAAKLYPVLLFIPLLALCVRAGKVRDWLNAVKWGLICWLVVNAPIEILFPSGWSEFYRLNAERPADNESVYNIISYYTGWGGFDGPLGPRQAPKTLNQVVALALIFCCAALILIALSAPRRPRFAQLALLVVAASLITNKVWSPQYSLWLVPLAVLAVPRWKPLLAWMVIDAV